MFILSVQLLWQDERKQKQLSSKQTFADLGCGNGLLVYILTSEGVRDLAVMTSIRKEREITSTAAMVSM